LKGVLMMAHILFPARAGKLLFGQEEGGKV